MDGLHIYFEPPENGVLILLLSVSLVFSPVPGT